MRRNAGFTLMEMLVVIAVLVILVTIAVPSYTAVMERVHLRSQIGDFASALNFARSESVKRSVQVTVCPSNADQTACGAAGTNWDSGWIVFVDPDKDNILDTTEGEGPPLSAALPLLSGYTLRGTAATTLPNYVSFGPQGTPSASGVIVLCHNSDISAARAVNLNTAGLIQVAPDNNDNGVPEDQGGADLTSCTP